MLIILLTFGVSVVYYLWSYYANVRRYPKGPTPVPIFGNTLKINLNTFYKDLDQMAEQYGPIFTVWLPEPHVFVCEYEHLKEIFIRKGDVTSGRGQTLPDKLFRVMGNNGIANSEGDNWVHQRRTSIGILRDLGMGKNQMNEMVTLSILESLADMDSLSDKDLVAFDPTEMIQLYPANVLNKLLFGVDFASKHGERLLRIMDILQEFGLILRSSPKALLIQGFPWLEKVPFVGKWLTKDFIRLVDKMTDSVRGDMTLSLKDYNVQSEPECFVQSYYQKMQTDSRLNMTELLHCSIDFFAAGLDTTAATLRWSFLFLADNQHVQDKLREEIETVVGKRLPTVSDRSSMPYTNAVIMEIQRMASIVAINLTHRTTDDIEFNGYKIPNNTRLIAQVGTVLHNSPVFDEPHKFKPERFLLEDGKLINKKVAEQVLPFSIGKRQCAGEGLARLEIFLGISIFFQKYKVEPCNGQKIDLSKQASLVIHPPSQKLKFTKIDNL